MIARQVKTPARRKKMPEPNRIWRFLSILTGANSLAGGGGVGGTAVFLFFIVLAIESVKDVKIQYYKSNKTL